MAKKSFAVFGLGRFGLSLIEELSHFTDKIVAIDKSSEQCEDVVKFGVDPLILDSTDEKALIAAGIDSVDHAIICFGSNLEATILTLVSLKNIGIKKITVRCDQEIHKEILEKLGATDIVSPQKIAGVRLANRVVDDNLSDYFNLSGNFCVVEIDIPEFYEAKTIIELDSRKKYGVNIILIKRNKDSFAPGPNDLIKPLDHLYVFGKRTNINMFTNSFKD